MKRKTSSGGIWWPEYLRERGSELGDGEGVK